MFLKRRAILLLALLAVWLPGCGQTTDAVPILTEIPQPATLRPGQRFAMLLNADRLAGLGWKLGAPLDEARVKLTGSTWVFPPGGDPQHPQATETWQFQAVGPGEATIRLDYANLSDPDAAPIETRTFAVVVQP